MPTPTHYRSDNRRLEHFLDPLLQPRIVEHLYGRDQEIETLLTWLRRADTTGELLHPVVVAEGGTGKTELCKAALKQYLEENPETPAWFVSLEAASNVDDLWQRLADAQGWDRSQLYRPEQILANLPAGLFYLDNLESVGDLDRKEDVATLRDALQALSSKPGVRLLASCRVAVPNWGKTLDLGPLRPADAAKLFCEIWPNSAQPLTADAPELLEFVKEKLGGLPLVVVLVAAQGAYEHTLSAVQQRWKEEGHAFANSGLDGRLDNLGQSIRLSLRRLSPDARLLWGLSAFFPTGLPEDFFQELLGQKPTFREARNQLLNHRIWHRDAESGRLRVSPPLAQFALDQARSDADGFEVEMIFEYLGAWLKDLGVAANKNLTGTEILRLKEEFLTLETTVLYYTQLPALPKSFTEILNAWSNFYTRNSLTSRKILYSVAARAADLEAGVYASVLLNLGELEFLLGENDTARVHFAAALALYEKTDSDQGRANTLRNLGGLEFRVGENDTARVHFAAALALYEKAGSDLGRANTLRNLGELEFFLGENDTARGHYEAALALHEKTGSDQGRANTLRNLGGLEFRVGENDTARVHYVAALALYEKTGSDQGRAATLLNLGELEFRVCENDTARGHYAAALTLFEKTGSDLGRANTLVNLGAVEFFLGEKDTARSHYAAALALYEKTGSDQGRANTLLNLGRIDWAEKNWTSAQTNWQETLAIFQKNGDPQGQAACLVELAQAAQQLGAPATAQQHLQAAHACAERLGSPDMIAYVAEVAAEINGTS